MTVLRYSDCVVKRSKREVILHTIDSLYICHIMKRDWMQIAKPRHPLKAKTNSPKGRGPVAKG